MGSSFIHLIKIDSNEFFLMDVNIAKFLINILGTTFYNFSSHHFSRREMSHQRWRDTSNSSQFQENLLEYFSFYIHQDVFGSVVVTENPEFQRLIMYYNVS